MYTVHRRPNLNELYIFYIKLDIIRPQYVTYIFSVIRDQVSLYFFHQIKSTFYMVISRKIRMMYSELSEKREENSRAAGACAVSFSVTGGPSM